MCTAISFTKNNEFLFGRTMDWFHSYGEGIIITPRNHQIKFKNKKNLNQHYAIIGMGIVCDDYPLYFDAFNEKGLCVAALNFKDNAFYNNNSDNLKNIASYELILYILGRCDSTKKATEMLKNLNITNDDFNADFSASPLHWIISDKHSSITVESVKDGLKIYNNTIGVLTNNPPFLFHVENIRQYMSLSNEQPKNNFSSNIVLTPSSYGFGAIGLPGDMSSVSRFIRAAFIKENALCFEQKDININQFFHILSSVSQIKGITKNNDEYEYTIYSSCCDCEKGIYYYKTYDSNKIYAVSLQNEDLSGTKLICYVKNQSPEFEFLN